MTFKKYTPDRSLCVYSSIFCEQIVCMDKKNNFLSVTLPYKLVVSTTISRWVKCVIKHSGIDVDKYKVSKGAKIRNRYNQVPHPTQDTYGKATNPQPDTTNESLEVSPLPAGDHKAHTKRLAPRHSNHKTEKT